MQVLTPRGIHVSPIREQLLKSGEIDFEGNVDKHENLSLLDPLREKLATLNFCIRRRAYLSMEDEYQTCDSQMTLTNDRSSSCSLRHSHQSTNLASQLQKLT